MLASVFKLLIKKGKAFPMLKARKYTKIQWKRMKKFELLDITKE